MMGGGPSLFRPQAAAGLANTDTRGTVLSIAPPSAVTIFALTTGLLLAGGLLVAFGQVNVEAEGRGVIAPTDEPSQLRAPFSTSVLSVDSHIGDVGKVGQTVVTLELPPETRSIAECNELVRAARERVENDERQIAAIEEAKKQDSALLVTMLRSQLASEQTRLGSTESRCKQTEALVAQAQVQFPMNGSLADIRVHPGQRVQAGEVLATVLPETSRLVAHITMPEEHRADVEIGKPARVRFDACPYQEHGVGEGYVTRLLEGPIDEGHPGFIAEVAVPKLPSGYCSTLRAGMALTGDIFVRRQRVGALLFRPLASSAGPIGQ